VAQVVWTDEAKRWLQDIYDYIAADNEAAAYRTVLAIHQRAEILLTFPEIGYRYRERPEIRVLLYGHYRIAYLISAKGDVEVSACSMARSTWPATWRRLSSALPGNDFCAPIRDSRRVVTADRAVRGGAQQLRSSGSKNVSRPPEAWRFGGGASACARIASSSHGDAMRRVVRVRRLQAFIFEGTHGATRCKAPRQRWHSWQSRQRGFCKLQILREVIGF
jgi:toxin ParE1/3/4